MKVGINVWYIIDLEALIEAEYGDEAIESYQEGEINERITSIVQGYWMSFMQTSNPNKSRKMYCGVGCLRRWRSWADQVSIGLSRVLICAHRA